MTAAGGVREVQYDPRFVEGRRRRGARRRMAVTGVMGVMGVMVLGLGATACDGDDEPPGSAAAPHPDADSYAVAIADLLPPGDDTGEAAPIVFLVPLDEPLALDAQATLIESFAPGHDIRFVDDLAAAIDADQPGSPPREEAVLVVGLGPIADEPPHLVRIERYRTADDVVADLVTLSYRVDHWVVDSSASVPAEVLVHGA